MIIDETKAYLKEVNDTKLKYFKRYYHLFEYSDSIRLISDNPQHPSMLNYVKTGLLTEDEMHQALLYKKE